jgi:hypothetical protein
MGAAECLAREVKQLKAWHQTLAAAQQVNKK